MGARKIYKATMVETIYEKVPNGVSKAMTSAEFGEMVGKSSTYLASMTERRQNHLVLDRYLVEKIMKDKGEYIFWVEEVKPILKKVEGTKEIVGGCKTIADELGVKQNNINRNCKKGFLIDGEYLITEVKYEEK